MGDGLILSQSEYEHLVEEIHKLQAQITELTALRDDLVYHVCPALRAEYDEKIVSLEREIMAAEMYLQQMKRTIEILQAQMNQQQEPSMEEAEAQAKQETKDFEEELHRKAEEAREFKEKWEKSGWAEHDREEKEREKENFRGMGDDDDSAHSGGRSGEGQSSREGEGAQGQDASKQGDQGTGRLGEDESGDGTDGSGHNAGDGKGQGFGDGDSSGNGDGDKSSHGGKRPEKETIAQKIKRLYRKIVKRLHPDTHPNSTDHEKDLLNQAMNAFKEGNLKRLEEIWDELCGMEAPEDVFADTPEGRAKLRELLEKLKTRRQILELEIGHIKEEFPYNVKEFLENPVAVAEVRRGMQSKLDNTREMIRQMEVFINELREKIRKGEKR